MALWRLRKRLQPLLRDRIVLLLRAISPVHQLKAMHRIRIRIRTHSHTFPRLEAHPRKAARSVRIVEQHEHHYGAARRWERPFAMHVVCIKRHETRRDQQTSSELVRE
jgi:hypothetical protein